MANKSSKSDPTVSQTSIPDHPVNNVPNNLNKEKKTKNKECSLNVKIACWNIRRVLIKREQELKMLLEDEKIDLLFVTETDTRAITSEKDYSIKGFKTILQKRSSINDNVRIICLVRTNFEESITILDQIMTTDIPTIWLELKEAGG